jgi:hypothetical protein
MRVVLRKVITSDQERNLARVMRADFGGLDADDPADTDIFFTFEDDTVDLPDLVKKPGTNLAQGHPQGPPITTPSASVLNTVSKAMFQEAFSS